MKRGTYVGPVGSYRGETALLLDAPDGKVRAQFDNLNRHLSRDSKPLSFGWHLFVTTDFEPLEPEA